VAFEEESGATVAMVSADKHPEIGRVVHRPHRHRRMKQRSRRQGPDIGLVRM
jgi:hypothetical protein